MERKLSNEAEREIALAYLCGVDTEKIKEKYGVSDSTTRISILAKRSPEWKDPLVKFYTRTSGKPDRERNATHLYLSFNNRTENLLGVDLVNLKRERRVYEIVNESLFAPRTRDLIKETNLEKILTFPDEERPSPKGKLLRAVFGNAAYSEALSIVMPVVYGRLKEAYCSEGKVHINSVYRQVKEDIFGRLRQGIQLVRNPKAREYAQALEEEKLSKQTRAVLSILTPREEKVLRLKFGIKEN